MGKIVVLEGQTLIDLAIQQCGSIEALFALAKTNGLSTTEDLVVASEIDVVDQFDKPIAQYYDNNELTPATALTADDQLVAAELEGISYWSINVDFIVQ